MSLIGLQIDMALQKKQVKEFLSESNAIERVYDKDSLVQAEKAFTYLMKQKVMSEAVVKQTHEILMKNQMLYEHYKGTYRDCDIYIGGRKGMKPAALNLYMKAWVTSMNEVQECATPDLSETESRILHVMYEKIHPFADGNGRTGRMFMNWVRIKKFNLPLLIIHEGSEQYAYYQWFW